MGDKEATAPEEVLSLGGSTNESDDEYEEPLFMDLIDTPNVEDLREELKGKETEPLAEVLASYPSSMKDPILRLSAKMLGKRTKKIQKSEALVKLNSKDDDGKSYIPGSLRRKNPIEVPNYLKGNEVLEQIAREAHDQNEGDKQTRAEFVRKMTAAA